MMSFLLLTEDDVRRVLTMDLAIEAVKFVDHTLLPYSPRLPRASEFEHGAAKGKAAAGL